MRLVAEKAIRKKENECNKCDETKITVAANQFKKVKFRNTKTGEKKRKFL